ncbi:MAG TPA: peptidoglycan DD-metalloendopeptidase family protein, partial [Anaerolineales bacterium]|nr:peptidoglycan DD-metalloendopeptidase family protein [Anaerolineales bacterium]
QEGDTLWAIAQRFGVSVDELRSYNNISDPNQIAPGVEVVIPGLEDVHGVLVTVTVPYGENLRSLSRRYQVPVDALERLNRLTSPQELYSGANLIIPEVNASPVASKRVALARGQSLLEMAVIQGTNPWSLVVTNNISGTWDALPGDAMRLSAENAVDGPGALPGEIQSVTVDSLPLVQGGTATIRLETQSDLEVSGSLIGHELHFFRDKDGSYVALQGVHAMTDPGFYSLSLSATAPDGIPINFSQLVFVGEGGYPYERLVVNEETVDPKITGPEDEKWNALAAPATSERYWDGVFESPVSALFAECWPSFFGSRRSYNGSSFDYFHTGLDFCGGVGQDIYAVASGVVVFAGPLTVRGNATMIDHGWGVYSAYMHQSEILVKEGEHVEAGQLIGRIGGTGRVTGSHLHLEILVGGVQVNPMDWLQRSFP